MINKIRNYFLILLFLNFGCANQGIRETGKNLPVNILMISVDDMNDWVGCLNGYPGVKTPNIDKLAKMGLNFTNAHCPSPKCNPSRTAILTGLMPSTTGIYDNNQWWVPNLPEVKTMPSFFKENGYEVLGGGKVFHHTSGNNPPEQWDEYFRLIFDDNWDRSQKGQTTAPWLTYEPFPEEIPLNGITPFKHEFDWGSLDKPKEAYGDYQTVKWAKIQLQKKFEKPFFMAVGFFHPHLPWYAPQEYFDKYPLDSIVLPKVKDKDLDDIPKVGLQMAKQGSEGYKKVLQHGKWKEAVQAYLANISFADYLVGEVLEALENSKYAKNTLIVLWSDHGWHLGEKEHWYKSTLWQRATHVPFILAGPDVKQGTNHSPVNLLDIFPTLLDYSSLKADFPLDGNSLMPFLKDPNFVKKDPTLITYREGNHALQGKEWKYIKYNDGAEELYNIKSDPNEWDNLASQAENNKIKTDMQPFLPTSNATTKPSKSAFTFDFDSYTWEKK